MERAYLDLVQHIIEHGERRGNRTDTQTLSVFGTQLRCNLQDGAPILTTKRIAWQAVVAELLWFISGSTDNRVLRQQGVRIWDGNSSRQYLDSIGLTDREEHDLGPIYGFQWRHFGAEYVDMHADYTDQGIDQLKNIIHLIRTRPTDRRIILSAWNPIDIPKMALPPCHMMAQFYVNMTSRTLSCQMYQRSADMGLGVPFNMASYALLTHIIAHLTDLQVGEFIHVMGDTHVYVNHVEALQLQLTRDIRPAPRIRISPRLQDIDDIRMTDIELVDYHPHDRIKMDMVV